MNDYHIIILQQIEDCRDKSDIVLQFTIDPKYNNLNHLLDHEYSKLFNITSNIDGLHSALNCNNITFLNILTNLRLKSYNIITSNAYLDIYTNCIVKSFYFEKIINNNITSNNINNQIQTNIPNNISTNVNNGNNSTNNNNSSNFIHAPKSEMLRKNSLLVIRSEVTVDSPLNITNESNESKNQSTTISNHKVSSNNNVEIDNKPKLPGPPVSYSFSDSSTKTIETNEITNKPLQTVKITNNSVLLGSESSNKSFDTDIKIKSNSTIIDPLLSQTKPLNDNKDIEQTKPSAPLYNSKSFNQSSSAVNPPPPIASSQTTEVTRPISTNVPSPIGPPQGKRRPSSSGLDTANINNKPAPPPPPTNQKISTSSTSETNNETVSVKPAPPMSRQSLAPPPPQHSQTPIKPPVNPPIQSPPPPIEKSHDESEESTNEFSYDNVAPTVSSTSKTDDSFQFASPMTAMSKVARPQSSNLDAAQKNAEYFKRLKEASDLEKQKEKEEEAKLNANELQRKREAELQAQQHDASKTQHYARLGGAFVNRTGAAPLLGAGRGASASISSGRFNGRAANR